MELHRAIFGYIYFPDDIYKSIPMKPENFTLGIIPKNIVHLGSTRKIVDTSLLQAKRLIAMYWNEGKPVKMS